MASSKTKSKGRTKKRAQRATSNVFAMFDQTQIQEFKEAFNMIDENKDGFIDKEDLHDILASLGKIITNLTGGGDCCLYMSINSWRSFGHLSNSQLWMLWWVT